MIISKECQTGFHYDCNSFICDCDHHLRCYTCNKITGEVDWFIDKETGQVSRQGITRMCSNCYKKWKEIIET